MAVATLTPVADAFTTGGAAGGSAGVLQVQDNNGNDDIAYLRFDLSGLDLDSITSATLTFHKVGAARNDTINSGRFKTYGLTNNAGNTPQTWSETTLDAEVGAEYQSVSGNLVNPALLFNLDAGSGANVTETVDNAVTPQSLSGPDVVAFLSARAADGGLATFITLVDAGTNIRGWGYASRENGNESLRPSLQITYESDADPDPDPPPVGPGANSRQVERLDRGLVAVRSTSTAAYLSWRLLGTDPAVMAFNVYRSADNGAPAKLNATPLTSSTNFVDTTANFTLSNRYTVRPVINGVEVGESESFTVAANAPVQQYLTVPLQKPANGGPLPGTTDTVEHTYSYTPNDASVGDVDGDGQLEIILKWDPSDSKDNSQDGYTGNVFIDAYKLDGTRLWRIDLGRNIRAGAHYTQFLVYDFDGDGKSEVVMRTAPGTIDGQGNPVLMGSDLVTADYRNSEGYILSGPEYLTVFNGETGANMSTIAFSPPRGSVSSWGDNYGNRVDRFLATVAYLDGVRPSIVMTRGYYAKTRLTAYDWRDGQLTQRWAFDSTTPGNSTYGGQGNHNLSVADVDADGKDEIVFGAALIDDNGQGVYSTGLGHGDAMHVSDMDPTRPGLEVWQIHEPSGVPGADFRDAATGQAIFTTAINSGEGPGRGVAADIWAGNPGYEMWGAGGLLNAQGQNIGRTPSSANSLVWWDADPVRELLDSNRIDKYGTSGETRLLTATGASTSNSTKSNAALSGDIFGDWREEVIWRVGDNALRIYTTTIPTTLRMVTLLHDTQYRQAIAWQNVAYNQPPHPSFFLGAGMAPPPEPRVYSVSGTARLEGDFNGDDAVDVIDLALWTQNAGYTGLAGIVAGDADGDLDVDGGDFLAWQRNLGATAPLAAAAVMATSPELEVAASVRVSFEVSDAAFAELAGAGLPEGAFCSGLSSSNSLTNHRAAKTVHFAVAAHAARRQLAVASASSSADNTNDASAAADSLRSGAGRDARWMTPLDLTLAGKLLTDQL